MQKRAQETRNRILQAAVECFSNNGYNATGVAEICSTAGVSKGAFYHHFASKQEVFIKIIHSWLDALDISLTTVREDSADVPRALQEMTHLFALVFQQANDKLPMFLEIWLQASRDQQVWEALIDPYVRFQEYFKHMLASGIEEGTIRELDPGLAARALLALAVGLLLQSMLDPINRDWIEVAEEGIHIFTQGLKKA